MDSDKKQKLNYTVNNQSQAEAVMKNANIPNKGYGYIHTQTPYKVGYEIHGIDNPVGLPHLKFWNMRTNGHIYWTD